MTNENRENYLSPSDGPRAWKSDTPADRSNWIRAQDKAGTLRDDVSAILAEYVADDGDRTRSKADTIVRLLESVKKSFPPYGTPDPNFLPIGPIMVPMSPAGLSFARMVRETAKAMAVGPFLETVDEKSPFGRMLASIDATDGKSGMLTGYRNATKTTGAPEDQGLRAQISLSHERMANVPSGTCLPRSLVSATLVGVKIDGDQIEKIREQAGMCVDGTSEFLHSQQINHEQHGGECDSCGSSDGEPEGIGWCESFTVDESFVSALEKAGYLDEVLEALDIEQNAATWSELLENDDSAILADLAPTDDDEKDGIKYDVKASTFTPDFGAVENLDELEFDELARILPILGEVCRQYETRGILPPVPGTLNPSERMRKTYTHNETRDFSLSWDPESGKLSHQISTRTARLEIDARNGAIRIQVPALTEEGILKAGHYEFANVEKGRDIGAGYFVRASAESGGETCERYVEIAQSKVDV